MQLAAAKEIIAKSLSVRKAEALTAKAVKRSTAVQEEPEPAEKEVDYAKEISSELTKLLGRKVILTDGKTAGKIEIEFYGADDRENLIAALKALNK